MTVGATFAAVDARGKAERDDHRKRFEDETARIVGTLDESLAEYDKILTKIEGWFVADGEVAAPISQDDFIKQAAAEVLLGSSPGLHGIGWAYAVEPGQPGAFWELYRSGNPEALRLVGPPDGDRAVETPIVVTHGYPLETMGLGIGVDVSSLPLEVSPTGVNMASARDAGDTRASELFPVPVQYLPEDLDVKTFALSKPVYDTPAVPRTEAERRARIVGWVGALVDGKRFLANAAGDYGGRYRVELYQGAKADDDSLIAASEKSAIKGGLHHDLPLERYGRQWTIRLAEAEAPPPSNESQYLLSGGLVVSLLLFALLYVMSRSENRALRMVDEATEELSRKERQFRALVANATDLITVSDDRGLLTYLSPASRRMLGCDEEELLGRNLMSFVHPDDADRMRNEIAAQVLTTGTVGPLEFRVRHLDGSWRYVEATGLNMLDDPAIQGIVFNCRDITERKAFEHDLAFQATHDPLTGLPNRTLLLDRLDHALAQTSRTGQWPAVLFVDLDRFKFVNDSLGHGAGDRLLARVAERLRHLVRPGDTVARFGGDEFVVLAEGITQDEECAAIAERVTEALTEPFELDGHEVFVTASIGIVRAGTLDDTPETLLRDADAAMYGAKEQGRARSEVFDERTRARALDRLAIENALHRALERDELVLHFQMQYDLRTGVRIGAEALLRWQHPERGLVSPLGFIELAEDTGLIVPIGEWVLRQACRQAEYWRRRVPVDSPVVVSANLSGRQLAHPRIGEMLDGALRESGLPPENLCLEITEGALMQDVNTTVRTLHALKERGVKLAIDDFGTGYASLGHLKRFPVDHLKIDRTFVDGLGHDSEDTVIVAAIIGLAHALGITAVAEGVETETQLAELAALRCDAAQGYLFARPMPASQLDLVTPAVVDRSNAAG